MRLKKVDSSNLAAVGYDPTKKTLRVRFKNGAEYDYGDDSKPVPKSLHKGLLAADSHGKYLNEHIKGQFPYRQVEPPAS